MISAPSSPAASSPASSAPAASAPRGDDDLRALAGAKPAEAARKFEGLFTSMLISEMKKTLPSGSFFGGGPGSDVYDGLLERELGESLSERGGLGLADLVERTVRERTADAAAKEGAS